MRSQWADLVKSIAHLMATVDTSREVTLESRCTNCPLTVSASPLEQAVDRPEVLTHVGFCLHELDAND